jgi:dienelactone hydrolase
MALALLTVACFWPVNEAPCSTCTPVRIERPPTPLASAGNRADISALLAHRIIDAAQPGAEVGAYVQARIPPLPSFDTVAAWEQYAGELRQRIFEQVVFRGEAARWRDADCNVEWLEHIDGGPGYSIRKLRYEAVPGLWIPALLYEPNKLEGRVPVVLNVNGHDRDNGKAVPYKQIRCINQAKRGMIALNVEWLGMGQLHAENFRHTRLNQLDLCGTSGVAPFYLAMKRGLDILLAHEHADPQRVAVTGLSGGGWQTIVISALDPRVTLAVPVAGYGSFHSTVGHDDLGDSEQAPCDLGAVADYGHLTALLAPRPALLTYNAKDDCCFRAANTLPPLLEAARPLYALYGKDGNLTSHVNHDPGTHNYEQDNREALYRMLGRHFYGSDAGFDAHEIACSDEVKTKEQLHVELPADNADFHALALALAQNLPHRPDLPTTRHSIKAWQTKHRAQLRRLIHSEQLCADAEQTGATEGQGTRAVFWKLRLSDRWTVPAVELTRENPTRSAILIADGGRARAASEAERLLKAGHRVLAVDPFYLGESQIQAQDPAYTYAVLLDCFGRRPLALQADQIAAAARWAREQYGQGPVGIVADGPRSSLAALVAAARETNAIDSVSLRRPLASLRQVIEQNQSVEDAPELFCFGLLERFDIQHLAALVAPRRLTVAGVDPRTRTEWSALPALFESLGGAVEFTDAEASDGGQ